jgi:hypothetical protein
MTVFELTTTGGWTGAAANAFANGAAEPVCQTLTGIARELERVASALRHGATTVEEAQFERRKAEQLAITAGVGVALTLLTFAISDVFAADAAAGAAAMMVRAAAAAASAERAVALAIAEAEAVIQTLAVRLGTIGPGLLSAAMVSVPRFLQSPAGAGLLATAETAGMGDTNPEDLVQAFAMSYLEGRTGGKGTEGEGEGEEPPPQGRGATIGDAPPSRTGTFGQLLGEPPPTNGEELWREITTEDGQLIGMQRKGSRAHVHELPDDLAHVEAYFNRLRSGGIDVTPPAFEPGGGVTRLPDGTFITFRPRSTSGPPTLECNIPRRGSFKLKFVG